MGNNPLNNVALALLPGLVALGGLTFLGKVELESTALVGALFVAGAGWLVHRMSRGSIERPPSRRVTTLDGSLLESLPSPILLLGRDRRVAALNKAARRTFAVDPLKKDLALAIRHPAVLKAADDALSGKGGGQAVEVSFGGETPRVFTVLVEPMGEGQDKAPLGAVVVLNDITSDKAIQEMRNDFVANVSHELRTPLSSIKGFIETLLGSGKGDAEATERFLGIMGSEAERMARLIDDLLSLSRIQVHQHVAPQDKVDLKPLIEGIAESLVPVGKERGVTIKTELPDDLMSVLGDRDQLYQVFVNLVNNAIKYGNEGGTVRLKAEPVDRVRGTGSSGIGVSVSDSGEGIPQEHIPRLTERFYRVDKARSRQMGGTGLGLAIVKHIVTRHRGRLIIESRLGEGSTFTVQLPAAERTVDSCKM